MRCIEDDASDKAIGTKTEIEIDIRGWSTQWLEGLDYTSLKNWGLINRMTRSLIIR